MQATTISPGIAANAVIAILLAQGHEPRLTARQKQACDSLTADCQAGRIERPEITAQLNQIAAER